MKHLTLPRFHACILFVLTTVTSVSAGATDLSAPAKTLPSPAWAVGQAHRAPSFDVLPGFRQPPAGFGAVPFYWWLGDPLTKERLSWQLERMSGFPISGLQINYAHSDKGGKKWGLTIPSAPPLFSPEWWNLTGWFLNEAKRQGSAISLSDYTLGPGQQSYVDELLREHPDLAGKRLVAKGDTVSVETVPGSLSPLHPEAGRWYADKFFGEFERRFPGEAGKGLNFFFSDELDLGVSGWLWSDDFEREFKSRKGYDIVPERAALFRDIGPRTPKIRMDYSDVMVALCEERFFKPIFDWHQQRGMILGCDHGGRGQNVVEFGDYFRTQRWNQGPGSDQPGLGKNLIKAKVAASIAHLYERPRVWLEGFYGSGWGTTSAGVVDATFANFVMGYNLLSLHGMYYSTHGGWWEWAPPDNTFRMPYWDHLKGFMGCVERLSFLLAQGHHRCDLAILYPVAAMEAGPEGKTSVQTAFAAAERAYSQGVDFDFIDFESVQRATIEDGELRISGERYKVLVLPAMKAIRHGTLVKALEFKRRGGIVVDLGALPEATDRIGRDDPEVAAIVKELFPNGVEEDVLSRVPYRDYHGAGLVQHRKIGERDVYAIYGAALGSESRFRATGKVELWNPWTGAITPLGVISQDAATTRLRLPLSATEIQLIVFSPGKPTSAQPDKPTLTSMALEGDWEFELVPTLDNRFGDFHWPPTQGMVGAEARRLWYCEGERPDGPWKKVTVSFGPQFVQSSSLTPGTDATRCEFSWRWGIEDDPGHQGYHGLKEESHDEFLAIGTVKRESASRPTTTTYTLPIDRPYFSTTVVAPQAMTASVNTGALAPAKLWINGEVVTGSTVSLKQGANPLVAQYTNPGRAYLVLRPASVATPKPAEPGALASRWWTDREKLVFDVRANEPHPIGWYRFVAPPGLRSFTVKALGSVKAWAGDNELKGGPTFTLASPAAAPVTILLRVEQERGAYGGAAFLEPITLDCGPGRFAAGDWSKNEGLEAYSGGVRYRKTVQLTSGQVSKELWLNLGKVAASAEVRVNGKSAGILVAPPWRVELTGLVKSDANTLEVEVYNTLANHYLTVPTRYRGSPESGLLGPVSLEVSP